MIPRTTNTTLEASRLFAKSSEEGFPAPFWFSPANGATLILANSRLTQAAGLLVPGLAGAAEA